MRDESPRHLPVLHTTVLDVLSPQPGETVLDVTMGLAGHARSFAEAIGEKGSLIGIDADRENQMVAREALGGWKGSLTLHHANFLLLPELGVPQVDILFADLGLSSPHLDVPERGFTFRSEGPLDMRFDRESGETAADLLERLSADQLVKIFRDYGEIQLGAYKLAEALAGKRFPTTLSLAAAAEGIFGWRTKAVLPQVFQALRIAVNRELEAVQTLLAFGPSLLKAGGRMGVISFHSLEDRLVKHAFRALTAPEKDPVTGKISAPAPFELLTPKALVPSDDETAVNPRSRSAKFRAIRRLPD
jgi:16S rRNA (cytosine1402-N4)-methyltransferase